MLIPKKNRELIFNYLFNEGVVVAKNDLHLARHPEIDVPNIEVVKLLTSLKSKKLVREQYAWRHYYWFLENAGVEYLREYLHLDSDVVPETHKKTAHTAEVLKRLEAKPAGAFRRGPPSGPRREGREGGARPEGARQRREGPPREGAREGGDRRTYRREGAAPARKGFGGAAPAQ